MFIIGNFISAVAGVLQIGSHNLYVDSHNCRAYFVGESRSI